MNNTHAYLKPLLLTTGAILIIAAGYIAVAYAVHMWPFKAVSVAEQAAAPTDSRQAARKEKEVTPVTPYNLKFTTKVKADEQGDCVLTMQNGEHTLTQKSSSKGTAGEVGCPEWKLDTSKLPSGKYEVTVVFTGETVTEKTTTTITLP